VPEGDTLHRIARVLTQALVGRPITGVESPVPAVARAGLVGRVVVAVEAQGKNLLIRFDDGRSLYTHLRMTGSWHVYRPGEALRKSPRAVKVLLATADILAVCFSAPVVELLAPIDEARHRVLTQLGPDLLGDLDPAAAVARLELGGDRPIGEVVMDQRVLAGIGNVFKSELLFMTRLDPWRPTSALTPDERRALVELALVELRRNADATGPRTLRRALTGPRTWVYGRSGAACLVCGERVRMRRQGLAGRSTYYCPRCQGVADA
jgi:endonuclease-8